jgi:uncharacterized protein YfdQ (DUF2303 family)
MREEHKTEVEAAYELGASTTFVTKDINGIEHVLVPPGSTLKSMERLMPTPQRIVAHPALGDIKSFATYAEEFQDERSRIFVDDSRHSFCIVFDGDENSLPGWGDHSCSMSLQHSHEWMRFLSKDGKEMSPVQFAEFLEDNLAYLNDAENDHSASDILVMAQKFKLRLKGDVEVEETLTQGLKTLVIRDDSTLRSQNSNGNEISFPEKLHFNLRIFKNHETYPLSVHLRYRIGDTKVSFFIKIPDPELLVEQAFDQVIETVASVTKLPTLKGVYDGPRHK